jgi:hypothetical protein
MAAGPTYEPIATYTFPGGTNSTTFTSIPSTYTDLRLVISYQLSGELVQARFNSDTGSNYSCTNFYANGSSAASNRRSNFTEARLGIENVNSTSQGVLTVDFFDYSNTAIYKTFLSRCSNAAQEVNERVGLWRSTSAISTIQVSTFNGSWNFSSGDQVTLYGIVRA